MSDNLDNSNNNIIPPAINNATKPTFGKLVRKAVVNKSNDRSKKIVYSLQETVKEYTKNQKKLDSIDVNDSLEKVKEWIIIAYGVTHANLMEIITEANSSKTITDASKKANEENIWIKGKLKEILSSNPFINSDEIVLEKARECMAIIDNSSIQAENLQKNKRNSLSKRVSLSRKVSLKEEVEDMENLQLFNEDTWEYLIWQRLSSMKEIIKQKLEEFPNDADLIDIQTHLKEASSNITDRKSVV